MTKYILFFSLLITALFSCENSLKKTEENIENQVKTKNKVLVLGTIHDGHLTEKEYNIDVLKGIIKDYQPDYILTEIPPDRYDAAMDEFVKDDTITEERVRLFPEYVNVIFPLTKEMDFEIIPTAGWTKEMALARREKLKAISENPERADDWKKLTDAEKLSDSLMTETGRKYDPYWINSDAYDSLVEIELSVYNDLFNDELGLGGWDNINKAHYKYISEALDLHKFEGKRILITYGAGHKGWFLRELKKRDDIELVYLEEGS